MSAHAGVQAALHGLTGSWRTEQDLAFDVSTALRAAGFAVEHEVQLSHGRIDLRARRDDGRVGIELKLGAWNSAKVLEQLLAYAQDRRIDSVALVATEARLVAALSNDARFDVIYALNERGAPRHPSDQPLTNAECSRLRRVIVRLASAERAVEALGVSEKPLMRAAAGLPVRRITRVAILAGLARHEEGGARG